MTLLIILCALVITRWSSLLYAIRTDGRLFVYVESLIPRLGGNPYLAMGIVLLFSIGLILMLQSILMSFAFGFLGWLFSLLVLTYCLNPTPIIEQEPRAFYQTVLQDLFSVIFWFVLCGPAGCFAYRLVQQLAVSLETHSVAQRFALWLLCIFDWVPARLLALTFSFSSWRYVLDVRLVETYEILYRCGCMDEPSALVNRSLFIWLVALALLFIF